MNKNMNHAQLYFLLFTCETIERDLKFIFSFDILGTNSENLLKTKKIYNLDMIEPISNKELHAFFINISLYSIQIQMLANCTFVCLNIYTTCAHIDTIKCRFFLNCLILTLTK